jgi:hypothetical protein
MVGRPTQTPTKAAVEARPTSESNDVFAGRAVRQRLSDEQHMPTGDNRHRVNHSDKFYVVQLIGSWVNVVESAERVVKYRNRLRWVTFENKEYELRRQAQLKPFVGRFLQFGCYAYVGGRDVYTEKELKKLVEKPFIYIASAEALRIFNDLMKKTKENR